MFLTQTGPNMTTVVDLTRAFDHVELEKRLIPLRSGNTAYTGVVYNYAFDSMQSTYIDFPGHIVETDDSVRADSMPISDLYRRPADVIHMDFNDGEGAVTSADLIAACPPAPDGTEKAKVLIINALGHKNPRDISERSVFLDGSAVQWIIESGYKLLVSDIYESRALHGVFKMLFSHGVTTVCEPVNLFRLTAPRVWLSAIPCPIPGVTQLPCRLLAEF